MTRSLILPLVLAAALLLLGRGVAQAQAGDAEGRKALAAALEAAGLDCEADFPVDLCAPQAAFVTQAEVLAFRFGVARIAAQRCAEVGLAPNVEAVGRDAALLEKAMRARGYDGNRFFLFNRRTSQQFPRRLARYRSSKKLTEPSIAALCAALAEDLGAGAPIARYLKRGE